MEVFTLIARKKNVALVFVSYLLVALAAISLLTICIGFAPGILFAVVFGLIAYLMIMAQNTEFEYSYFLIAMLFLFVCIIIIRLNNN
jgi:hypothetical protein